MRLVTHFPLNLTYCNIRNNRQGVKPKAKFWIIVQFMPTLKPIFLDSKISKLVPYAFFGGKTP